jgi:uncharacterized YccA/Bax inhibitor family protein
MALFQSGNPTLSEKIFNRTVDGSQTELMTVRGSIKKFGFLLLMVFAGAAYTWKLYNEYKVPTMMTLFWVGMIGGFIAALIMSFKPATARFLAPAYGVLEGFFLGAISVIVNNALKEKYPDIVFHAVMLTFAVAFAMFLLYNYRIIKPNAKFRAIVFGSMMGIALFYLVDVVLLYGFHIDMPFMRWNDSSPLGIGISLFVIGMASLMLILDFERLEKLQDAGAPKYMEWYGAFGLLVTLVWLYLEILKLLSRLASRR